MHAFDILGDPVRRRIPEPLADGEQTSGATTDVIRAELTISQHLGVLRDSGFASMRTEGARRFYTVEPTPLSEADAWPDRLRRSWEQRLDALGTELARGRRARPPSRSATHPAGQARHRYGQNRSTTDRGMT
ncbi:transcriptional regulator [Nonomuraea sp. NPDC050643]|uniref:ArsR/SmtB family transcription factor n=1 Tax=Nonomuraea sp. NPDC050643 TaxID=3155660 RepID=UPI0033E56414